MSAQQDYMDPINAFIETVKMCSYKDKPLGKIVNLTNMTFFIGAGFSKSWDINFPTGEELFNLTRSDYSASFYEFVNSLGYSDGILKFNDLKEIFYQVSMQKKYPAIRKRYVDKYNLELLEDDISRMITNKFNRLIPLNYLKNANDKLKLEAESDSDKSQILSFFKWLTDHSTGDHERIPEGLRINYITTNYDFLLESILDTILGEDDSQLLYTYRGFTPKTINNLPRLTTFNDHWLVQTLIKINGGFDIFKNNDNSFNLNYIENSGKEDTSVAPLLILPNREQDYTGSYFQTIFPKAVRTLQESQILVVVGYSVPDEDALIRLLLRQFAEENVDGLNKIIFYIDLMPIEEQLNRLQSIFPYHSKLGKKLTIIPYCGYFNQWVRLVNKNK